MVKSFSNRIYLKQKIFRFKMDENKSISVNIDVFTKLIQDLENLDNKIDGEHHAVILLNS